MRRSFGRENALDELFLKRTKNLDDYPTVWHISCSFVHSPPLQTPQGSLEWRGVQGRLHPNRTPDRLSYSLFVENDHDRL